MALHTTQSLLAEQAEEKCAVLYKRKATCIYARSKPVFKLLVIN